MTLDDLLTEWRGMLRDTAATQWYSDDDGTRWFNEAQMEASRRCCLLIDSEASFCTLSLAVGVPDYALDPRIVLVMRGMPEGATEPLWVASQADLDLYHPGWEAAAPGPVVYMVPDYRSRFLRLSPPPAAVNTVTLTVAREPLMPLVADGDIPEINHAMHMGLLDWVLYRSYSQHDADTYDPVKAKDHYDRFEEAFGARIDYADQALGVTGFPRGLAYGQDARMGGRVTKKPKPPEAG